VLDQSVNSCFSVNQRALARSMYVTIPSTLTQNHRLNQQNGSHHFVYIAYDKQFLPQLHDESQFLWI